MTQKLIPGLFRANNLFFVQYIQGAKNVLKLFLTNVDILTRCVYKNCTPIIPEYIVYQFLVRATKRYT